MEEEGLSTEVVPLESGPPVVDRFGGRDDEGTRDKMEFSDSVFTEGVPYSKIQV